MEVYGQRWPRWSSAPFPRTTSYGALFTWGGGSDPYRHRFYGPAQGRVIIPASRCLGLAASYDLVNNMSELEKLPPDVIKELTIDRIETSDDKPIQLKSVGHLTGLVALSVKDSSIDDQGVGYLKSLTHLKKLSLWYCGLHGDTIHDLVGLKELCELDLSLNRLSPEAYKAIAKMPQLKKLQLSDGSVNDAALAEISKLSNVEDLNIGGSSAISTAGLQYLHNFKKLSNLNVSRCKLSVDQLVTLKGLPLRALTFSGRNFDRAAMQKLHNAFPGVILIDADPVKAHDKFLFSPLH